MCLEKGWMGYCAVLVTRCAVRAQDAHSGEIRHFAILVHSSQVIDLHGLVADASQIGVFGMRIAQISCAGKDRDSRMTYQRAAECEVAC